MFSWKAERANPSRSEQITGQVRQRTKNYFLVCINGGRVFREKKILFLRKGFTLPQKISKLIFEFKKRKKSPNQFLISKNENNSKSIFESELRISKLLTLLLLKNLLINKNNLLPIFLSVFNSIPCSSDSNTIPYSQKNIAIIYQTAVS